MVGGLRLILRSLGLGLVGLLSLTFPTEGHDPFTGLKDPWSKEWCCNGSDCKPTKVWITPAGIETMWGEVFEQSRVIWQSPDGLWYRCGVPNGKSRCLIGPRMGS